MVIANQRPTKQEAQLISDELVRSFPSIEAVLVCGSVARGDANEWSDLDLVVIGADTELTPARLRDSIATDRDHISLIYFRLTLFRQFYREGSLFIAHLRRESVILYDRVGQVGPLLRTPFEPTIDIAEGIKANRAKLQLYSDPKRFNDNFLFCFSHLYSIGKGVVMLGLAGKGVLEFNRDAAFRRFASLYPDLSRQTETVARLRPFYRLVTGREPEALPFPYQAADKQMQEAVGAIQALAERAESR